jgi:hypothetical protein
MGDGKLQISNSKIQGMFKAQSLPEDNAEPFRAVRRRFEPWNLSLPWSLEFGV